MSLGIFLDDDGLYGVGHRNARNTHITIVKGLKTRPEASHYLQLFAQVYVLALEDAADRAVPLIREKMSELRAGAEWVRTEASVQASAATAASTNPGETP